MIKRCRNLATLTTHGGDSVAGLTTRVVGVRFDHKDDLDRNDLRFPGIETNPQVLHLIK